MFCKYCGTEIPEGSKFCPHCGARIDTPGEQNNTDGSAWNYSGNTGSQSGFEKQANDIGRGVSDAAQDMANGFKNAGNEWKEAGEEFRQSGQEFSQTMHDAGQKAGDAAEHLKNNWRDYLTPDNIEIFVACSMMFPLFMVIVRTVILPFTGLPFIMGGIFGIVRIVVSIIFILASLLSVAGAVYLLMNQKEKQTVWGWVTLAAAALGAIATIGVMAGWGVITTVLIIATAVFGIDLISRVCLQKLGIESTPDVARDLNAYQIFYNDYKAKHPSGEEVEKQRIAADPKASYFDGKGSTLFGLTLLMTLVSVITCSIATPWMLCKIYKWRKTHTVIDGRRLDFNGTGGSLLGHWILWTLLDIVTCGIYSYFEYVALCKWEMSHTYYQDGKAYDGKIPNSFFDGNSFQFFGYGLLASLVIMITCGIGAPWMINMIEKWQIRHSVICGDKLQYDGTALGLFVQYIVVFLLTIVTLGIYSPWGNVRIYKYLYAYCHVQRFPQQPLQQPEGIPQNGQ